MNITTSTNTIARNNTFRVNQNITTQRPQRYNNINLVKSPQSDTVNFTGAKQIRASKKFVEGLYGNLLSELGFKNGPKLTIKTMALGSGGFSPAKGEITFSEKLLKKKSKTIGNVLRHELKHFEQFSLIARMENGIEQLENAILTLDENSKPMDEMLKKRSIFDDFLFKNKKKKAELLSQLNETFDRENFRTFWQKVVEEKGHLGFFEKASSKNYLENFKDYPSMGELLKSFKEYKSAWNGILTKTKVMVEYTLNPLEREAYGTGNEFAKENKTQLKQLRKACKKPSSTPDFSKLNVN